jgi:hypothetical protein
MKALVVGLALVVFLSSAGFAEVIGKMYSRKLVSAEKLIKGGEWCTGNGVEPFDFQERDSQTGEVRHLRWYSCLVHLQVDAKPRFVKLINVNRQILEQFSKMGGDVIEVDVVYRGGPRVSMYAYDPAVFQFVVARAVPQKEAAEYLKRWELREAAAKEALAKAETDAKAERERTHHFKRAKKRSSEPPASEVQ